MNQLIKKYRAIEYMIFSFAVCLMLLIQPAGILDRDWQIIGHEQVAGETQLLDQESKLQQVFRAEGSYLKKISLYAMEDLSRKTVSVVIYDELGETLFSRKVALDVYTAPGFFTIPVEVDTVPGRYYVCQLSHAEMNMHLAYQDTAQTGLDFYGSYYYGAAGQKDTVEYIGNNLLMRFEYTNLPGSGRNAAIMICIGLVALVVAGWVEITGRRRRVQKLVKVQWAVRRIANPLIVLAAAASILAVTVFRFYGGIKADRMVYLSGILVLALILLYVVNAPRAAVHSLRLAKDIKTKLPECLQTVCWAGVFWGCIDYVNAMYNIYQEYAYRKVLLFTGLALLTMCGVEKKKSAHKATSWKQKAAARPFLLLSIVWTVLSGIGGSIYYQGFKGVEELDRLARLDAWVMMIAGLVVLQLIRLLLEKRIPLKQISIPYAILLAAFCVFLVAFRNTRGWPVYLVILIVLFYLFLLGWENRSRFLGIFCNGIILNFMCALVFAVLRRPLRAWLFYRYNFVFHTVTVTAAYLTLVICALFVKLLMQYHKSRKLTGWWSSGLLFGIAASLLLMTFSRTGYLAAVVMGVVILFYTSFVCYREKVLYFLQKTGILIILVIACFPITYSAVRLIPPVYDDPYLFELEAEPAEWAIHKGDRADSENYMTFRRFVYCMDEKLFGDDRMVFRKFVDVFMSSGEAEDAPAAGSRRLAAFTSERLLASAADTPAVPLSETGSGEVQLSGAPESVEEDYSNGRFDIFGRYMAQWNLTGHDEMGVPLADGSLSVHAHNTYLQVIHDHGIITGMLYLLLGVISLICMFRFARKAGGDEPYAVLPLAVFIAFAVAGLVEWLFHPCNPFGFAAMAVLAPLLTFKNKTTKVKEPE